MSSINNRLNYYLSNLNTKIEIEIDTNKQEIIYYENNKKKIHPMYYCNSIPCIFVIDENFNYNIFKKIWDKRLNYLTNIKKIKNQYLEHNSYYNGMDYEFKVYCKKFIDYKKIINKKLLMQTGDVHFNTPLPIITKTRPIYKNEKINNVILRLEEERHWFNPINNVKENDIPFNQKENKIIWRGGPNGFLDHPTRPTRKTLVLKYYNNQNFDIGFVSDFNNIKNTGKGHLSMKEQLESKFLISVEGGDVATGLKWMLYSNSVVLMAKPTMEGWFMEGTLKEWVHYIPLDNDFSDLEEKYDWCLNNLNKCEEISKNATKFIEQFMDEKTEKKLEELVIKKYMDNVNINIINNTFTINTLKYKKDNNLRFYIEKQDLYLDIVKSLQVDSITNIEIDFYAFGYPKDNFENDLIKMKTVFNNTSKNDLFIFNELDFSNLREFYNYSDDLKNSISKFLKQTNYIIFFCEILINQQLQTKGSDVINEKYAHLLFSNARKIICCDTQNIKFLSNITDPENIIYFPPLGYSKLYNTSFIQNNITDIDILFYGNINPTWIPYRSEMLEKISLFRSKKKLNFIKGTFHGDKKEDLLKKSKIIVHIPSYEKLRTFPWAKTVELMLKKVFFIIEENDEMYNKELDNIVVFYKHNDIKDLEEKIDYYINNPDERSKVTERCYEYINSTFNMDNLFESLLH